MSEVIIYGIPGSPYVRQPMLACEEKGVPWRIEALGMGEHKQPAHLARHPFGRIPAIEHDGFTLYETQAILRYIDRAFDGPALSPADARDAARMDQVMNVMDSYVMPSLTSGIGFNRIVAPIFGIPVNEDAVKAAIPQARTALKALEDLLGAGPYFGGDRISLADLSAVAHLEMAPQSPEGAELMAGSPLLAWLERMGERPSVQKTTMQKLMGLVESASA